MDEILKRDDIKNIINEIVFNEKYYVKISTDSDKYYANDMALYIFYEALLKYYLIFENSDYLGEYIYDIDLLFRKIDSIEDIRFGISKLITKFTMKYLGIEVEDREKILRYIFDKYIINGYLIHGFSSVYSDNIVEEGFSPNNYYNFYDDFIKLNEIIKKYKKDNFIDKDFREKIIYFSDDIIKACIYSINSPMYYCNLLTNNEIIKDKQIDYYKNNYDNCLNNFNSVINELGLKKEEKEFAVDLINKEWDLLHKKDRCISLLLVKRELFKLEDIKLEDIVSSDLDINEAVDRLLTVRYNNVSCDKSINVDDLRVINFEIFDRDIIKKEIQDEEKEKEKEKENKIKEDFNDTYGMVSPLLLFGSLLISLGVIVSIIHLMGG